MRALASLLAVLVATVALSPLPARAAGDPAASNAATIRAAFDAWTAGTGSVFDLLADDVDWTVAGSGPATGRYRSRADFMARAVQPITARLATPIAPRLEHLVASGDDVVVIWRGSATRRDGLPYANHYAWHLTLRDGRIVQATAFLDTIALADLKRSDAGDALPPPPHR